MSELVQSFGDSTEPMVVLDGVSKVFGNGPKAVVAVDNVSLSINRGEIFAIIGYSGAGKSTLVRLINGLETTTSGTLNRWRLRNFRQAPTPNCAKHAPTSA